MFRNKLLMAFQRSRRWPLALCTSWRKVVASSFSAAPKLQSTVSRRSVLSLRTRLCSSFFEALKKTQRELLHSPVRGGEPSAHLLHVGGGGGGQRR